MCVRECMYVHMHSHSQQQQNQGIKEVIHPSRSMRKIVRESTLQTHRHLAHQSPEFLLSRASGTVHITIAKLALQVGKVDGKQDTATFPPQGYTKSESETSDLEGYDWLTVLMMM